MDNGNHKLAAIAKAKYREKIATDALQAIANISLLEHNHDVADAFSEATELAEAALRKLEEINGT